MDGIEWTRAKWGGIAKAWFWLNDWAGCWLGNHLVADHPSICDHLATRTNRKKITTIAYGAHSISDSDPTPLVPLKLVPGEYLTLIARPEPENSILEAVRGFSLRERGVKLVVLGNYDSSNAYHQAVMSAASSEVVFLGAIYDQAVVHALRYHSFAYVHGHQVGGTNPSLVEALGAGNAVIAHDNRFNKWVAGDGARYFSDERTFDIALDELLCNKSLQQKLSKNSSVRFSKEFTWSKILSEYESLLQRFAVGEVSSSSSMKTR